MRSSTEWWTSIVYTNNSKRAEDAVHWYCVTKWPTNTQVSALKPFQHTVMVRSRIFDGVVVVNETTTNNQHSSSSRAVVLSRIPFRLSMAHSLSASRAGIFRLSIVGSRELRAQLVKCMMQMRACKHIGAYTSNIQTRALTITVYYMSGIIWRDIRVFCFIWYRQSCTDT